MKGSDVYDLAVDRTPQQTKVTAKAPVSKTYYRASHDGITFTVDQAFMDAMNAGTVAKVVLNDGQREVKDPLNPDAAPKMVRALSFGSFATREQLLGAAKFDAEIKSIENPELNAVKFDDLLVKKIQEAVFAKQIAQ